MFVLYDRTRNLQVNRRVHYAKSANNRCQFTVLSRLSPWSNLDIAVRVVTAAPLSATVNGLEPINLITAFPPRPSRYFNLHCSRSSPQCNYGGSISFRLIIIIYLFVCHHHHHQPIDVPTAGAAFLMDYTYGERAITRVGPVRVAGC
jgi:hypothetical protein